MEGSKGVATGPAGCAAGRLFNLPKGSRQWIFAAPNRHHQTDWSEKCARGLAQVSVGATAPATAIARAVEAAFEEGGLARPRMLTTARQEEASGGRNAGT